jgi:predicted restriction endonuclease
LHHVVWWRHGGRTDLDNLLPVCVTHHQHVHNDSWLVSLGPNRELTIELPDGQIMTTGPPTRNAA